MVYEVLLFVGLLIDLNLCVMVFCMDVLFGVSSFLLCKGYFFYVEGYCDVVGKCQLVGYVFLLIDIVDMFGYLGKFIIILMGMDVYGVIMGVKVL